METGDTTFAGSIPEIYERDLGPLLFEPYAQDLAARAAAAGPRRVLEIAAGTGIVTRALLRALPQSEIVATDLNEPMLAHARALVDDARVRWETADAQALPFDDRSFDAVVCQFGVMFFPDQAAAFAQAARVLAPGGSYLFNVWDDLAKNELSQLVNDAVRAAFPDDPPQFIKRVPFRGYEPAALRAQLESIGFSQVEIEPLVLRSRAPSCEAPARGLCQGTPLRNEILARDPGALAAVTAAATQALAQRYGTGGVDAAMSALVVTARR